MIGEGFRSPPPSSLHRCVFAIAGRLLLLALAVSCSL